MSRSWIWVVAVLLVTQIAWGDTSTDKTHACKENLESIMRALTQYARDHHGDYPSTLAALSPRYLKQVPQCPAAGEETYSRYSVLQSRPARAALICSFPRHLEVPDYLVVSADRGAESPFQHKADPAICRTTLLNLNQSLDSEKSRLGRYPKTLTSPPRCSCGEAIEYMARNEGQDFIAFCPGAAHLGSGLAPFSPSLSAQGLHEDSLLLTPPQPAPKPRSSGLGWLMAGAAAVGLLLLAAGSRTWKRSRPIRID